MKSIMNLIGIILLVVGIVILGYQGFTYTKKEKVAEIGDLQITADTQKTVYFPPIAGGLSFVAGLVLLIVSRNKS